MLIQIYTSDSLPLGLYDVPREHIDNVKEIFQEAWNNHEEQDDADQWLRLTYGISRSFIDWEITLD